MATDMITLRRSKSIKTDHIILTSLLVLLRRKKESREPHARSEYIRKLHGLK